MKLFFWDEPYPVDYGNSLIYAVAETEEQARNQVEASRPSSGEIKHAPVDLRLGPPTLVLDPPCAQWNEWYE